MMIILIFLLAIVTVQTSNFMIRSNNYDPILWRYFNDHPPSLLVSIQVESDLHEQINYSLFQDWQTIHFVDAKHLNQAINSHSATVFHYNFNQTSSNKSNGLSLNFQEICDRYFIERPTFMMITHPKIDDLLENSLFWTKSQCIPKILLLKFSQYASKILEENKWALIERSGNYAIYLENSSQAEYNEKWQISSKMEQSLSTLEWNSTISSIKKLITSNFNDSKVTEGTKKQTIQIYDIKQKVISISDILDELAINTSEISYVVMRNFNADYNVVIVRSNYSHTVHNISNFVLENITLTQHKITFFFPRLPIQNLSLIDGLLNSSGCVKSYDVEEQVFVKIRGNVGNMPEQLAAQTFIQLENVRQPTSIDAGSKPTSVQKQQKPSLTQNLLNQDQKIDDKIPQPANTQIKYDKIILIAMASILVLTLAIFAIRQVQLKRQMRSRMKIITKIQQIKQTFQEISITQQQSKLEETTI